MKSQQQQLIDTLKTDRRFDRAEFNGRFLNCCISIKSGGKTKKQKCSLIFDDPATLGGARVLFNTCVGAYSESFARDAFFEAVRIGSGDAEAVKFANECRESGVSIGASQQWIDAHRDQLSPFVVSE